MLSIYIHTHIRTDFGWFILLFCKMATLLQECLSCLPFQVLSFSKSNCNDFIASDEWPPIHFISFHWTIRFAAMLESYHRNSRRIYLLFRAQRWHVQFLVIWTFWFQVITISQDFMVHRNFQLFSAVLVANEQTHFGDMSSFVQDLTKSDCKFLDLHSTKVTCHMLDT